MYPDYRKEENVMKKYLVIDTPVGNTGDEFVEAFETLEDANKAAEQQWNHLTKNEQKHRHVLVGIVTKKDLYDDDEDWTAYHSYNTADDTFNSERA